MPLRLIVQVCCDKCPTIFEGRSTPRNVPIPSEVTTKIGALPPGWKREGDTYECPAHEEKRIEVVPALPAGLGRVH